jgi:hypothetical protein
MHVVIAAANTVTDVRVTHLPGADRDVVDWTALAVAFCAALGTVGAVLVALFLPRVEERRRRPRLTLSVEPHGGVGIVLGRGGAAELRLRIHNARGKQMAREVEVHVISWAETPELTQVAAEDEPLQIDNPFRGAETTVTSVAPGHSRSVSFAVLDEMLEDQSLRYCGYFGIAPRERMGKSRMEPGRAYNTYLAVTGSNFDAIFYRGVLEFTHGREPVDDQLEDSLSLGWKDPLSRVSEIPESVSAAIWLSGLRI